MNLGGVHLALDDVEDGDVAVVQVLPVRARADHHVLGLQQPPHHVQHRRLPDVGRLLLRGERRVASHQEVEARGGDQGRDQADQIVVHVSGLPQGGRDCPDSAAV